MIPININYFVLNNKWDNLRYFFKRGHFFSLAWDRFKWFWFPSLNIIPDFPQTVDIETSLSCQLNCPMCTRARMSKEALGGIMEFNLYKKIINEIAEHKVFSVKLSWRGEPTMNPKLVDMVKYAKDKGIRDVAFLTNGGLLDKKKIIGLIKAGLDWISFSIDGMYEEYEKIRAPIKFDQIVQTVKTLHRIKKEKNISKPLVRIQTISGAIKKYPEYFDFWSPYVDRISCIADQHRANPDLIKHDPDYICQAPFQRVFVTWNGVVVPCHGDYHLHHNLGNVTTESIKGIWQSDKFSFLRKQMRALKRLDFKACRLCPDGGEYTGETLSVQSRKIPAIKYSENQKAEVS